MLHGPHDRLLRIGLCQRQFAASADLVALGDERCAEVYDIQVEALRKRLAAAGVKRVVIGISGGLDSTQAALVAVRHKDDPQPLLAFGRWEGRIALPAELEQLSL